MKKGLIAGRIVLVLAMRIDIVFSIEMQDFRME